MIFTKLPGAACSRAGILKPLSIGGDDEDDVGLATAEGDESESGEDDNADSDEESEEDVEVDQELRDAVAKAIASSGLGAGDEADEEDEDEDAEEEQEEEPLDDEQMMALDDQLAEIFRQRKATSGKCTTSKVNGIGIIC